MAIAIEIARATGWRLRAFPWTNCRDIPSPPPEPPRKKLATGEKTLTGLLDESSTYAERKLAEIKKQRRNTEIREETTGEFYKRYRGLCQKRLGEDKAKGRRKK